MIRKIKNLKVSHSPEYEKSRWLEAKSRRNKLLSSSDWTQLPDNGISDTDVRLWREWRERVRSIRARDFDSKEQYIEELKSLEQIIPGAVQNTNTYNKNTNGKITQAQAKNELVSLCKDKIYRVCFHELNHMGQRDIMSEKYEQALDFLSEFQQDDISSYPLIALYASQLKKSYTDVANQFIEERKQWLTMVIEAETKKLNYTKKLNGCTTEEDLQNLLNSIY